MQTSYTSAEHAITVGSKSRMTARIGSSRGKWCQSYITRVPQSIVTKDGPVGHIQLTAACLDLPTSSRTRPALTSHLLTTHRAVPSTTSFLSHEGKDETWVDAPNAPARTGRASRALNWVQEGRPPLWQSGVRAERHLGQHSTTRQDNMRTRLCHPTWPSTVQIPSSLMDGCMITTTMAWESRSGCSSPM